MVEMECTYAGDFYCTGNKCIYEGIWKVEICREKYSEIGIIQSNIEEKCLDEAFSFRHWTAVDINAQSDNGLFQILKISVLQYTFDRPTISWNY